MQGSGIFVVTNLPPAPQPPTPNPPSCCPPAASPPTLPCDAEKQVRFTTCGSRTSAQGGERLRSQADEHRAQAQRFSDIFTCVVFLGVLQALASFMSLSSSTPLPAPAVASSCETWPGLGSAHCWVWGRPGPSPLCPSDGPSRSPG